MPANRNALLRYKTIDLCLQNRYRQWTLEDLIEACSEALYEYEGIDKGLSKRTIQSDIQMMRSDKLGYNAPILVVDRKFYTYEDPEYSITNIPLSEHDLDQLSEAVEFMKQFQGFDHFQALDGMVQKLEDHITSSKQQRSPIIDFEKNENLKGIGFLNVIYQAILKKKKIALTYQSFKAREASSFKFNSYVLKEYRNRWFVLGKRDGTKGLLNLALDRIIKLESIDEYNNIPEDFNAENHFKNVVGVSVSPNLPLEKVVLKFTQRHSPYVETKPIHHSQKKLEKDYFGTTFSYWLQPNFEFEREILGFGEGVKVLEPLSLKRIIRNRLKQAEDVYATEFTQNDFKQYKKGHKNRGYLTANHILTNRECKQIFKYVFKKENEKCTVLPEKKREVLDDLLSHPNMIQLFKLARQEYFIFSINCIENVTEESDWSQLFPKEFRHLKKKKNNALFHDLFYIDLYMGDTTTYGVREVISRSHTQFHKKKDIQLISKNTNPQEISVRTGGVFTYHPALIQRTQRLKFRKPVKAIRFLVISKALQEELDILETSFQF